MGLYPLPAGWVMGFLYYAAVPSGHNSKLYNDDEPLTRCKAGAISDVPSPTSLVHRRRLFMCVRIGKRTEGDNPQTRRQAHLSTASDISYLVAVAESPLSGCCKWLD